MTYISLRQENNLLASSARPYTGSGAELRVHENDEQRHSGRERGRS